MLSCRVAALDELQTETEANDRLVTEQRYQQHERTCHGPLQPERYAFEQVVQRQSQDQYHRAHCVVASVCAAAAVDGRFDDAAAAGATSAAEPVDGLLLHAAVCQDIAHAASSVAALVRAF